MLAVAKIGLGLGALYVFCCAYKAVIEKTIDLICNPRKIFSALAGNPNKEDVYEECRTCNSYGTVYDGHGIPRRMINH